MEGSRRDDDRSLRRLLIAICTDCGIEFDPLEWADENDPICDFCINDIIEADYSQAESQLDLDGPEENA